MSYRDKRYCMNCRYAEDFANPGEELTEDTGYECHRLSPALVNKKNYRIFPEVYGTDWCGEWKERENGR